MLSLGNLRLRFVLAVFAMVLLSGIRPGAVGGQAGGQVYGPFVFVNDTGEKADDFHSQFTGTGGTLNNPQITMEPAGASGTITLGPAPGNYNEVDIQWTNPIQPGQQMAFTVESKFPITLDRAGWTKRSDPVGVAHLSAVLAPLSERSQATLAAETQTGSDLITDTFKGVVTESSKSPVTIHAYRTDDLKAGDPFSGTVRVEAGDQSELNGVVYQLVQENPSGSQAVVAEAPVAGGVLKGTLAAAAGGTAGSYMYGRLVRNGKELARGTKTQLPPHQPTPQGASVLTPESCQFPGAIPTGKPAAVRFQAGDGDLSSTEIDAGGQPVQKLAESPNKTVFLSNVKGPTTIRFKKKGVEATGRSQGVGISISAISTTLPKGSQEAVKTTVTNLQGIRVPVTVEIKNSDPETVQLEGGNDQFVTFGPSDVQQPAGIWFCIRNMTATGKGEFKLAASVKQHFYRGSPGGNIAEGLPGTQPAAPKPPCPNGVDLGIVATTTACPNGKVVYLDTHQWWCPPDGHTETSVVQTATDYPCSLGSTAQGPASPGALGQRGGNMPPGMPAGQPQIIGAPPGGGGTTATTKKEAKGKEYDGEKLKNSSTRPFGDPNVTSCGTCPDPQLTEGKDKKIYCPEKKTCGGDKCPTAVCTMFYAWTDGAKGPKPTKDEKTDKENNEKWTFADLYGTERKNGRGKDNAFTPEKDHCYACVCK